MYIQICGNIYVTFWKVVKSEADSFVKVIWVIADIFLHSLDNEDPSRMTMQLQAMEN